MNYRQLPLPTLLLGTMLALSVGIPSLPSPAQATPLFNFNRRSPVVQVVEKIGPAVVNISTEALGETQVSDPFFFHPFRRQYRFTSIGSGLIFSEEGYVITNAHVIEKAVSEITVTTIDGKTYPAALVGASRKFDIAVLKVAFPEPGFAYHPLGCSDDILIGETVIAIGNSLGLSHTVTTGIISALNRSFKVDDRVYRDFIQTDASINPGNSGGPLLNINGEVIGINTAIYNGSEGIGFAIPAIVVNKVVNDILQFGEARSPWFGIFVQDLTPMLREYLKYDGPGGVSVTDVFQNGPGARSGLQAGDLILSLNGKVLASVEDYKTQLSQYTYDEPVVIRYWREGKEQLVTLKGSTFPQELIDEVVWEWLGFQILENSADLARRYRLPAPEGIVVSKVVPNGRAKQVGIEPGDIVWQVNGVKLKNLNGFRNAMISTINQNASEVYLVIQRGRRMYYVGL